MHRSLCGASGPQQREHYHPQQAYGGHAALPRSPGVGVVRRPEIVTTIRSSGLSAFAVCALRSTNILRFQATPVGAVPRISPSGVAGMS